MRNHISVFTIISRHISIDQINVWWAGSSVLHTRVFVVFGFGGSHVVFYELVCVCVCVCVCKSSSVEVIKK